MVDALHEGWIVDVSGGRVGELTAEKLEVLGSHVEGEEVQDAAKLGRGDHTAVALTLQTQIQALELRLNTDISILIEIDFKFQMSNFRCRISISKYLISRRIFP